MDHRLEALRTWLAGPLGTARFELAPASADASFRRYFRIRLPDGATRVAMDAPPGHEDIRPWLKVAGLIAAAGVHAPRVAAHDLGQGFVLMDDLGDETYLAALARGADPAPLYAAALEALVAMQSRIPARDLPPYDRALLRRELELCREWLCGRHLGLALSAAEHAVFEAAFSWLEAQALAMPRVFVHRDWHARNLMALPAGNPGVLDFQDAVIGPVAYDLVSLTRDAYVRWPAARIAGWLADYHARARAAGVPVPATLGELERQHDLIGVQRHLKVVGIFARLWHRDGKPGYLDDLPLVCDYLLEVMPRHAELRALDAFMRERVKPKLPMARARARAESPLPREGERPG